MTKADGLSRRALNRATLARQRLLDRGDHPALEMVEHLVGLNAQDPDPPYVGLWSRIAGFELDDLTRLLYDRSVVRGSLLRGTQHMVSAGDYRWLRPLLQPLLERVQRGAFGRTMRGVDLAELIEAARARIGQGEITRSELGRALAARWPGHDPGALARSAQLLLPVLHPPPDGTWARRGQTPFVLAEHWLGRPLDDSHAAGELVRRYLAAFGPASVRDVTAWSGLTRLGEVVDALRPRLRRFTDEAGRELVDLPDAPRPGPDVAAPVRFLAALDNVLLAHHDRSRIVTDEQRKLVFLEAAVTVDGFVRGLWRVRRTDGTATVVVRLFAPLTGPEADAVGQEGLLLARLVAPDLAHDLQLLPLAAPWPDRTPWDCSGMSAGRRRP
jgi:Winged helix DNA-binding domain